MFKQRRTASLNPGPRAGYKPRWWFYILTPIGAAVLTLAVIESCLAIFFPIPFVGEDNAYFEPDPFTGYMPKPNSMGSYSNGIPVRVNSNGHRDEFVSVEKAGGGLQNFGPWRFIHRRGTCC